MKDSFHHSINGLEPFSDRLISDLLRSIQTMSMDAMELLEESGYHIGDYEAFHTDITNESLITIVSCVREAALARQRLEN